MFPVLKLITDLLQCLSYLCVLEWCSDYRDGCCSVTGCTVRVSLIRGAFSTLLPSEKWYRTVQPVTVLSVVIC